MQNLIVITLAMAAGLLSQRFFNFPPSTSLRLNQFIIYLALPAIILLRIPALEAPVLFPMFACWIVIAVSALIIICLSRYFAWSRALSGALLMIVPLGNTSYFGYPMTELLLGKEALAYAILYDQLGNFTALAVYGSIILAVYSPKSNAFSWRKILLRMFSFPPFVALIIALFIPPLPQSLSTPIQWLAMTMAPAAMFIVGLQFSPKVAAEFQKPLYFGLAIKMVLGPVLIYALASCVDIPALLLQTSILEAGMPSMVTACVMASAAGLAPRFCASFLGMSFLASALSLPLYYYLLPLLA